VKYSSDRLPCKSCLISAIGNRRSIIERSQKVLDKILPDTKNLHANEIELLNRAITEAQTDIENFQRVIDTGEPFSRRTLVTSGNLSNTSRLFEFRMPPPSRRWHWFEAELAERVYHRKPEGVLDSAETTVQNNCIVVRYYHTPDTEEKTRELLRVTVEATEELLTEMGGKCHEAPQTNT